MSVGRVFSGFLGEFGVMVRWIYRLLCFSKTVLLGVSLAPGGMFGLIGCLFDKRTDTSRLLCFGHLKHHAAVSRLSKRQPDVLLALHLTLDGVLKEGKCALYSIL